MRAYELSPGGELVLTHRSSPPLAPDEVRIGVQAVSLNYRDLAIRKSASRLKRPIVPTSDGAGEILEVGARVSHLAVGDRVAGAFFPSFVDGAFEAAHHGDALGGTRDGMLAEEVVLPAAGCVKLPPSLAFDAAATLPCAGVTAYHALFVVARVQPGDTVLVQGTGGVSIFALQLARAVRARVMATSSSEEKRSRLRAMGASATFDYRAEPSWGKLVRQEAGGRGVDVALEVGGAGTFDQSIAALRTSGTMVLIGTLAGTSGTVDTYQIFHKAIRVVGIEVGSVRMFDKLLAVVAASGIEPVIDRVFPFEQAALAYDHLASGAHFGKVVVRVR